MIYATVEAFVPRRPEIVWATLTDVTGLVAWVEGLVHAEVISTRESGVGVQIDLRRRGPRGAVAHAVSEVTAWREPSLVAAETRIGDRFLFHRATLEPSKGGTELGVYAELTTGNAVAEFFARPSGLLGAGDRDDTLQRACERSVESLVRRIETLSAIPYR